MENLLFMAKKKILARRYKLLFGSAISSFSIGSFAEDPPLLNKEFYICTKCKNNKNRILQELIKIIRLELSL